MFSVAKQKQNNMQINDFSMSPNEGEIVSALCGGQSLQGIDI